VDDFKIGDLVKVGPAYQMGGTYAPDRWTGRTMRIVDLPAASSSIPIPAGADLAPADLVDPDSSDSEVWIRLTRLTKVSP
jgi:hypothetical protein